MKFSQFKYERPEIQRLKENFTYLIKDFNTATNFAHQKNTFEKINTLRRDFSSCRVLAYLYYQQDTSNQKYQREQKFFDQNDPVIKELETNFFKAVSRSPFKKDLEHTFGTQFLSLAKLQEQVISPEVIQEHKAENELVSKYIRLMASFRIRINNKVLNISGLKPYTQSPDRSMRKIANHALFRALSRKEKEFDTIFDQLVQSRTKAAQKLGYKNFIPLGYKRLNRTGYYHEDIKHFRELVKKHVVPLAQEMKKRQVKRLGLKKIKFYDENVSFRSGNPTPKGSTEWIIKTAGNMYNELSPETGEFFHFMVKNNLMDLHTRKGKSAGGFCTFIENYKTPFIFANFNGTLHDVEVLTHEAGHAFQMYSSKDFDLPEYTHPTLEACEIHSMSMEFLTWPWMEHFFKDDLDKYRFYHLSKSLHILPYATAIDEFQHHIYQNPGLSPAERKHFWKQMEKTYLPHLDFNKEPYLENGGFWHRQRHIFKVPFYYIDYALAQICALQFWIRAQSNYPKALKDYIKLCNAGGSMPFLDLVNYAGLKSPFDENNVSSVVKEIRDNLDQIDDSRL